MQLNKRIILAAALSILGTSVFAQDVNEIINKNIDAMGGKDKLSSLLSVYEESTVNVMGNDLSIIGQDAKGFHKCEVVKFP